MIGVSVSEPQTCELNYDFHILLLLLLYTVVLIGLYLWNKSQYSTVEDDFYKLTTTKKLLRSNHSQARR